MRLLVVRNLIASLPIDIIFDTVDREIFSGRIFHLLNFRAINFHRFSNRRKLNATKFKRYDFFTRVAYAERNSCTYIHGSHTCEKKMECFRKESCVRGYYIYRELWEAAIGEDLVCQRECGNATDAYAARTAALYFV